MKKYIFPTLFSLIGNIITGIAVGIMKLSSFGVDPFSAMNTGLANVIGISFGTLQMIINAIFLIVVFFNNKKLVNIGTVFNMVLVGYMADLTVFLANETIGENFSLPVRILFLILGVGLACFGVGTYLSADVGVAPYDGLCLVVNKWFKDKIQYKHSRMGIDFLWVIVAVFCGIAKNNIWQLVGIITVIMAFCTGPLVQFFNEKVAAPALNKIQSKILHN